MKMKTEYTLYPHPPQESKKMETNFGLSFFLQL